MAKILRLNGIIRSIDYDPQVRTKQLERRAFRGFDINDADGSGIVEFDDETYFAYSKWSSPKSSRSLPSARIYNTYHEQTKRVSVIPVLKDEGYTSPNNDRLNYMTYSRMNLMSVYVILTWYESAKQKKTRQDRITAQLMNNEIVLAKMRELKRAQKSALHWNELHFKSHFEQLFRKAVESYQRIGRENNVEMHAAENHLKILDEYLVDGIFSLDAFAKHSLKRSFAAAHRESMTAHELEHLSDGGKAVFNLENRLGGIYHVTADEVFWEEGRLVIQESKNAPNQPMPSAQSVKDGLFKNILFKEIDELYLDGKPIDFTTRLKLTGVIEGTLKIPHDGMSGIERYADSNRLSGARRQLLRLLHAETIANPGLSIEIASNK